MSVSSTHSLRLQHSIHDAQPLSYCISNQEFNQFLANKQQNNNTTTAAAEHYSFIQDRQRTKDVWSRTNGGLFNNDGLSSSAAATSCTASITFKIIDGKKSRGGAKSGRISLYVDYHGGDNDSSLPISPSDLIHLRWKTITQRTFSTKSHVTGYHCGRTAAIELDNGSLLVINHENIKDKIGLHDGNAIVDDRHPPFLFSSGDASGAYLTIRLFSPSTYSTLYLVDLITHVDSLQLSLHSANGNVVMQCSNTAIVNDERHLSKRQRMRLLSKANQSSSASSSSSSSNENAEESNKKKPNKYAKVEEESSNDEGEMERKQSSSINEMKRSIDNNYTQPSTAELINEVDELESFGSDDDASDDESSSLDFDTTGSMIECSSSIPSSSITDSFSVRGVKRRQCSEATFFDEKRSFDFNECDDKMSFIPIEDPPINNSMPAFNSFIDNLPAPFTTVDLPSIPFFPIGSPLPFPSFSHDEIPLLPSIDYDRSLPFSFPHSPSIPTMQLMRNFSLTD